MKLMGIENTQYIIARHIDREHPHCHIVFNRVDNDGKTISDKNDFRRNEKVCKMLTAKYRLHFANGKDHIKEERLRPYDKAKHEIYKALKEELPTAHSWDNLKDALADREIDMKFKVSRTTREIQGVKFEHNGFSFSGSKGRSRVQLLEYRQPTGRECLCIFVGVCQTGIQTTKMKRYSKAFPIPMIALASVSVC